MMIFYYLCFAKCTCKTFSSCFITISALNVYFYHFFSTSQQILSKYISKVFLPSIYADYNSEVKDFKSFYNYIELLKLLAITCIFRKKSISWLRKCIIFPTVFQALLPNLHPQLSLFIKIFKCIRIETDLFLNVYLSYWYLIMVCLWGYFILDFNQMFLGLNEIQSYFN